MRNSKRGAFRGDQKGVTLVIVAVALVVFFLMAALSIDLGVAYTGRTTAQHAADAGALSGALALSKAQGAGLVDGVAELASRNAAAVSNTYKIFGQQVSVSTAVNDMSQCAAGSNIVCVDLPNSQVTVVVSSPVQTYFARIIPSLNSVTVRARATAEAAKNALGDRAIKPFYIPNDAISPLPLNTKNRCQESLNNGYTILDANGNLTDYAKTYIGNQSQYATSPQIKDPTSCFGQSGCPVPFWTQNADNPSQYGLVDLSGGQDNAGALVECAITHAYQDCFVKNPMYKCGAPTVGIKTGGSDGQVATALSNVIGYTNDSNRNIFLGASQTDSSLLLYQNTGSSSPEPSSPSVISVVIWDCTKPLPNGTTGEVQLQGSIVEGAGIAQIFVNRVGKSNKSGDVSTMFLVGAASCGNTQGGSGPGGLPVRLVHSAQ